MFSRIPPRTRMCDNCPFGDSVAQQHMRASLRPGRFDDICLSVMMGQTFVCHKTTRNDEDDNWTPSAQDRECAGAIEWRERQC